MGASHGYLPWEAHVQVTMGIPWNCMGLLDGCKPWISSMGSSCAGHHGHPMELHGTPGWVQAMDIFHGKLMCRSPWASHGIAWDSWMGACHGYLPWQAHVEITMGITWNCIGTPGWVHAMDIFHGKLMCRSPWASHGIALGLLDGCMPWISSMASSCGDHH